jgi:hypothetical protein
MPNRKIILIIINTKILVVQILVLVMIVHRVLLTPDKNPIRRILLNTKIIYILIKVMLSKTIKYNHLMNNKIKSESYKMINYGSILITKEKKIQNMQFIFI